MFGRYFKFSDFFQQIVGGFLLSGPFVITEEVWSVARALYPSQALLMVLLVFLFGYGTLYKADVDLGEQDEVDVAGVPNRFLSLILVSYCSVILPVYLFSVPTVFEVDLLTTLKGISLVALFSVVGAATADSVF